MLNFQFINSIRDYLQMECIKNENFRPPSNFDIELLKEEIYLLQILRPSRPVV